MLPIRSGHRPIALATLLFAAAAAHAAPALQAATPQAAPAASSTAQAIEWLTDAEGRTYRLEPLPKAQGTKIDEGQVRTMWGVPADLAKEDEQFFYIKIYKVGPPPAPTVTPGAGSRARGTNAPPAAAATAKPAAPARPEALPRPSQRLRWTGMSDGLPTSGQWREGLVLADLNGDGRLEIVLSPARKSLRGPGALSFDGTRWARAPRVSWPEFAYDYGDVAVGDVNADGKPDLVFGIHLKGVLAMTGGDAGAFTLASEGLPFSKGSSDPAFSTRAILLADCNGDRTPDIIALGEGPRLPGAGTSAPVNQSIAMGIATFIRQDNGAWRTVPVPSDRTDGAGLFGSSIAAGDVDGDGAIDLVVAPGTLGDARLLYRGTGACGWTAETVDAARPRSYYSAVAAADLDGDRRADIVAAYTEFAGEQPFFGLDRLSRDANGAWTRTTLARASGRGRYEAIAIADIDMDGANDIAVVDEQGTVRVFLGDGRGGFSLERSTIASPGGCRGASIAIGDLDRDGLGDIVVGYAQEVSSDEPSVCRSEGGVAAWRTQHIATARGTATKAAPAKKSDAAGAASTSGATKAAAPKAGAPKAAAPEAAPPKDVDSKRER